MGTRGRVAPVIGGKWRLERRIGRGGMASVYAAVHTTLGHRVAVKLLSRQASEDAAICARFRREGKLANKVRHDGAIKVMDDGVTDDGRPFLIMELLQGETLDEMRHRSQRGRLSLDEVLESSLAVADILAAAHDAGVVHRDVKPSNIFVTNEGAVKLVDFGVAGRRQSPSDEETATGIGCGTPMFMAPEQIKGDDRIDARADVFALATTMYRLLSGRYPYEATSLPEYLRALTMGPKPPRLDELVPEVNASLASVIEQALAIDPNQRVADARAFARAIGKAVRSAPPEPSSDTVEIGTLASATEDAPIQIHTLVMKARVRPTPIPPISLSDPRVSQPSLSDSAPSWGPPPMALARPSLLRQSWPALVMLSLAALMCGLIFFAR